MFHKRMWPLLCAGTFALVLCGCGGAPEGEKVEMSQAEGVVLLKGSPLAGASVTFIPEKGPAALGTTDLSGKFKLSSGSVAGVAVGKCKVAITSLEAGQNASFSGSSNPGTKPSSPDEMKERLAKMSPGQQYAQVRDSGGAPQAKSLINLKYADPEKSQLEATVEKDASKNKFTFDLKD